MAWSFRAMGWARAGGGGPCPRQGVSAGRRRAVLVALAAGWLVVGAAGRAVAGAAAGCGLGREAALVVTFEVELVFGVLGAGAPGVGQGLDESSWGAACSRRPPRRVRGRRRRGRGRFSARASASRRSPGPARSRGPGGRRSWAARLSRRPGQRGRRRAPGEGSGGLLADLGDSGVCLVVDGLGAGISGIGVGAGGVGGLQGGLGVVPGSVHGGGGCFGGLDGPGGLGEGDRGFGLGLAAVVLGSGERGGDPAGVGGGQLGGGRTWPGQRPGRAAAAGWRSGPCGCWGPPAPGGAGGQAVLVVPLA